MYNRSAEQIVSAALQDTPVVLVQGPHNVGKTTLLKEISQSAQNYEFISFADNQVRAYAQSNPTGLLRDKGHVILDEIQFVPEIFSEIGRLVDLDPQPGKFLLAASANVYSLSNSDYSLTGKIESIDLLPITQFELLKVKEPTFLKKLFNGTFDAPPHAIFIGKKLRNIVRNGGFPEPLSLDNEETRDQWRTTYLTKELMHRIDEIAEIDNLIAIPNFVKGLAERSGQIINFSQFGRQIGMSYKTGQRYWDLLEQLYLTAPVYPFQHQQLKSVVKAPKLQFLDTGILSFLLDIDWSKPIPDQKKYDQLVKNFVFCELSNLVQRANNSFNISFYRGFNEKEVDFVIDNGNQLAGISVTANATIKSQALNDLRNLKANAKDLFAFGVLLYDGEKVIPFEDDLFAVPISALWD